MTDFTDLVDLAAEALGGRVVAANDEFFAPKEGLIKASPPEWREGEYTERGKWMDGWETRRRRTPGYDWAIIKLGVPGKVRGMVIDTSFFTGNYPERASIEGCALVGPHSLLDLENAEWHTLLPESQLAGNVQNRFETESEDVVGHVRLNIFPDGGVARLRIHGEVSSPPRTDGTFVDTAAIEHGGFAVVCSDMHYGHRQNLIMPGRSTHMGNGWETKRRRGAGHDWTIIRLGSITEVHRIEVDTDHFKGNAPDSCMIEGVLMDRGSESRILDAELPWDTLVPKSRLQPHARHVFETEPRSVSHVRLNIYPDGGVARLRVYGRQAHGVIVDQKKMDLESFNGMPPSTAAMLLGTCCGSSAWVAAMLEARPFEDVEDMLMASEEIADRLQPHDWLEAFRHHPRIGESRADAETSAAAQEMSADEQAAASESTRDITQRIAEGNREYEKRFGFIFIIRAAGRTADEVLAQLEERLSNEPDAELAIAAQEQRQITNLRLVRLFGDVS